ncbi:MAG: T9SS type A sorting domain-containing protein [Flavobacteriales bacterium]
MKFFTLSILAFCSGLTWAQAGPIDFQSNGFGANWLWTTFENGNNPALEIVANPDPSGINLSSTVAKFTAQVTGAPWAGFESVHGQGIGVFNLTAANCQIKMMVYKSVISPVGLKFATPAGGSTGEILVSNTLVNQWEELTFNFNAVINAPTSIGIDQIIVFPDFAQRSDNNICYIDNIKFSNQDGSQNLAPMVAAPTPTYPAAAVIALFSNPYQEVPVDTWQAAWSQAQVTDLQIQGNDTKRYSAMNFAGIETVGPHILDLSAMTHFRIDYWTANMNPFKVKLVDFGNDGQYAGGDDSESELSFQPVAQTWNILEIPLSQFSNLNSLTHFAQLILSGEPAGSGVVFVDNVLFFDENQSSISAINAEDIQIYPNPAQGSFTVRTVQEMQQIRVLNAQGKCVFIVRPNATETLIDTQTFAAGTYFLEFETAGCTNKVLKPLVIH